MMFSTSIRPRSHVRSRLLPTRAAPAARSALPGRFRQARLLIVGCGDVGLRVLARYGQRRGRRWLAVTSDVQRRAELRAAGALPLVADLDDAASLRRLAGLVPRLLHLAPPRRDGLHDDRTRALLHSLARAQTKLRALAYVSTTGVYGDCGGALVNETRAVRPATGRARRRVDAEQQVRALAVAGTRASVLRAPGIYARDRTAGTPEKRLRDGVPALAPEDDIYTNHIHADDLARACFLALWRGRPARVYNAVDDSAMKLGDYLDMAAAIFGLPPPARISRSEAEQQFGEMRMSFLRESRRLENRRIKTELRMHWRYPSPREGLQPPGPVPGHPR